MALTSAASDARPGTALGAHIDSLLRAGRSDEALVRARALVTEHPADPEGLYLLARVLQQRGDGERALSATERALAGAPDDPWLLLLWVELTATLGRRVEAIARLRALAGRANLSAALRQQAARLLTHFGLHEEAERCYAWCARDSPQDPHIIYNWASALTAVGHLVEAEAAYDRVIELAPHDADAYYNRATLRAQTPARNHISQIEARLSATAGDDPSATALNYALAKELEDIGQYSRAFVALKYGADARRRRLTYQVAGDVQTMAEIAQAFDAEWLSRTSNGHADHRPIFIVGLPRSGTTLVDRILSSHSSIRSRGESSDLAAAVTRWAAPARDKSGLIHSAARADPARLGADYCRTIVVPGTERMIDKTPLNFLYVGLIKAAMPNAIVIHVERHPLDVCYAMYKTLFRMAYPFSYSLDDLGRYYLAYVGLMAHWRRIAPDAMFEVQYEELVCDQEAVTRRLLEHCGCEWEPSCLSFERNSAPTLTASAAQVRQPIYRTSVGFWRHYADELAPLRAQLAAAGVDGSAQCA